MLISLILVINLLFFFLTFIFFFLGVVFFQIKIFCVFQQNFSLIILFIRITNFLTFMIFIILCIVITTFFPLVVTTIFPFFIRVFLIQTFIHIVFLHLEKVVSVILFLLEKWIVQHFSIFSIEIFNFILLGSIFLLLNLIFLVQILDFYNFFYIYIFYSCHN